MPVVVAAVSMVSVTGFYMKALLYEKHRNYAMARSMYEEAIRVCGQNAFYEACLKRIEDKK